MINEYQRGSLDPELNCINYHESCVCFGVVKIFESYPAQYSCLGIEYCNNIAMTRCG